MRVIFWHQGELERAAAALRAAVDVKPDYVDAHLALGGVLKARGDLTGATRALRRAISLDKALPTAHYTLGLALQQAGDVAGARAELDEAERLRRRGELEHEALVATSVGIQKAQDGDLSAALAQFPRATQVFDEYAPAHYQRGLVLQRLGREDDARAAFGRAQQLNPSLVPPRNTKRE